MIMATKRELIKQNLSSVEFENDSMILLYSTNMSFLSGKSTMSSITKQLSC